MTPLTLFCPSFDPVSLFQDAWPRLPDGGGLPHDAPDAAAGPRGPAPDARHWLHPQRPERADAERRWSHARAPHVGRGALPRPPPPPAPHGASGRTLR